MVFASNAAEANTAPQTAPTIIHGNALRQFDTKSAEAPRLESRCSTNHLHGRRLMLPPQHYPTSKSRTSTKACRRSGWLRRDKRRSEPLRLREREGLNNP